MYRSSYPQPVVIGVFPPSVRPWVARLLRRAARQLSLAAHQFAQQRRQAEPVAPSWPQVEFHAYAGAPEGALFVDGEYVGQIGVSRL